MEDGRTLQAAPRLTAALSRAPRPVSISSSSPASQTRTLAAGSQLPSAVYLHEEEEMEGGALVFGPTPSQEEVAEAVTAINQIFCPVTLSRIFEEGSPSSGTDLAVKSPSATAKVHEVSSITSQADDTASEMKLYNTRMVDSGNIINAFRSLQINPSIQRMVTSLSSDKAVWNAVMKNAAVKELIEPFREVGSRSTKTKHVESGPDMIERILDWILQVTKAKILEILYKAWKIASDIFFHKDMAKVAIFEEAVRSAFMLSVVVFMVVVAFRVFRSQ